MFEFLKKLFGGNNNKSGQASSPGPDPVAMYALTSDTPKNDPKPGQVEPLAFDGTESDSPGVDSSDVSDGDFDFD